MHPEESEKVVRHSYHGLGKPSEGVLVGAFFSMSSTTVVLEIFYGKKQYQCSSQSDYIQHSYSARLCCGFAICSSSSFGWYFGYSSRSNINDQQRKNKFCVEKKYTDILKSTLAQSNNGPWFHLCPKRERLYLPLLGIQTVSSVV